MHDIIGNKKLTWLVTGCAGFIGSHITQSLLGHGQKIIGLDDLSACGTRNLDSISACLSDDARDNFHFIKGDIRDSDICDTACSGVDIVLHQAAIGSVPRSFDDLNYVDSVNIGGFLTILNASIKHGVRSFIYASSSAVYGNATCEANHEDQSVHPLSPYAVGKYSNELYAQTLSSHYDMSCVGLRYFNIYGARQDPHGAYAAVIPKWINQMHSGETVEIYGDGSSVRDFCHVKDAVQANILAALSPMPDAMHHRVYNVGCGHKTSLNDLYACLQKTIGYKHDPIYRAARLGDIDVSWSNIDRITTDFGFMPQYNLADGLAETISGYGL